MKNVLQLMYRNMIYSNLSNGQSIMSYFERQVR